MRFYENIYRANAYNIDIDSCISLVHNVHEHLMVYLFFSLLDV